jgi:regulator of sigma D
MSDLNQSDGLSRSSKIKGKLQDLCHDYLNFHDESNETNYDMVRQRRAIVNGL